MLMPQKISLPTFMLVRTRYEESTPGDPCSALNSPHGKSCEYCHHILFISFYLTFIKLLNICINLGKTLTMVLYDVIKEF